MTTNKLTGSMEQRRYFSNEDSAFFVVVELATADWRNEYAGRKNVINSKCI
jgi:hypothetical protein